MSTTLSQKQCLPCEGGVKPLEQSNVDALLEQLHPDWSCDQEGRTITRTFKFGNYYQTIAFVNAVAWIAHQEDHHPDLSVGYNRCTVNFSTHAIGGLSENDFICASKIDDLQSS